MPYSELGSKCLIRVIEDGGSYRFFVKKEPLDGVVKRTSRRGRTKLGICLLLRPRENYFFFFFFFLVFDGWVSLLSEYSKTIVCFFSKGGAAPLGTPPRGALPSTRCSCSFARLTIHMIVGMRSKEQYTGSWPSELGAPCSCVVITEENGGYPPTMTWIL